MNKLSWITNALACLMIVVAALGAVCGAVFSLATDINFYCGMSRRAVMDTLGVTGMLDVSRQTTAYIGLTDEEQHAFADQIVRFMHGETERQPDILNEKEQQHMLDVRDLVMLAQKGSKISMTISAILAVIVAWTGAKEKRRGMPIGVLFGLLIVASIAGGVYALLNTAGFERMFVGMHKLLFTNDLWLMDPAQDILIRMMPQMLFERAGMEIARLALRGAMITWVHLCVIYILVGNMVRRNLTEREKK